MLKGPEITGKEVNMALRKSQRGKYSVYENLGQVSAGELETLRSEVRRMAKQANQRLVRLEKESKYGTSPAYKRAKEDLATEFGAPRNRYRESVRTATREELITEYRSLREFITAKSSTVAGYQKIIDERYENFKKQTGADLTEDEYVEAWEKISADEKSKESFYKSQFRLIKETAKAWKRKKRDAEKKGKELDVTWSEFFQKKQEQWNGQKFIRKLREEQTGGRRRKG